MEIGEIVAVIITGLISVSLLVYTYFASKEKGPILSNTYLFASKEERKYINKSAEYRLVTIVFGILGIIFLLLTIEILTSWNWLNFFIGLLIVIELIYVIIETIKTETKR